MSRRGMAVLGVLGFGLVVLFQNCSKVGLEQAVPSVAPFFVKGEIEICLENSMANYTLDTLLISNLNITPSKGAIVKDSDSDGIPDSEEEALGLNPLNRRSNGKLLDSLCLDLTGTADCLEEIPNCSATSQILGLNECDLKTMRLDSLYGHPTQGLDSDKDGIVDVIELLLGTMANADDRNDDPDHDGVMNWVEIQRGTNPIYANRSVDESQLLHYSTTKVPTSDACAGELWKVSVESLPLAEVQAYQDPLDNGNLLSPSLSHDYYENVITVFLKLKTQAGSAGNSKIYFKDFKINRSVQGFKYYLDDFKAAGEVLP